MILNLRIPEPPTTANYDSAQSACQRFRSCSRVVRLNCDLMVLLSLHLRDSTAILWMNSFYVIGYLN